MKGFIQYLVIGVVAVLATLYFSKGCEVHPPAKDSSDSLKTVIKGYIKAQDSLKNLADSKDSVRIEYRTRWRERSGGVISRIDSIPCDSLRPIVVNLVNSCDSVIAADSSQIATLKQVISADSLIILNKDLLISADSVKIAELNKDIKKRKRREKFLVGALVVTTILAIIK
jgi:hypothetical protein